MLLAFNHENGGQYPGGLPNSGSVAQSGQSRRLLTVGSKVRILPDSPLLLLSNKESNVSNRNRAWRRAQKQRIKEKAKRKFKEWNGYAYYSTYYGKYPEKYKEEMQRWMNSSETPCMCSKRCCGNPRRHEGGRYKLTLQERRQLESEKHYIDEFEDESYEWYIDWLSWHTHYDYYGVSWDWWYDYQDQQLEEAVEELKKKWPQWRDDYEG